MVVAPAGTTATWLNAGLCTSPAGCSRLIFMEPMVPGVIVRNCPLLRPVRSRRGCPREHSPVHGVATPPKPERARNGGGSVGKRQQNPIAATSVHAVVSLADSLERHRRTDRDRQRTGTCRLGQVARGPQPCVCGEVVATAQADGDVVE